MNTITQETFDLLCAPFPVNQIMWRVGATTRDKDKGIALAYFDARDAMERLDSVLGPGNWQRRYPWASDGKLCCEVGVLVGDHWVWKSDGAGDTDYEAHKGAFSDSFKRACVSWGIGRYLYDLPNVWMPIEPQGKSYGFSKETKHELNQRLAAWQDKYFQSTRLPSAGVGIPSSVLPDALKAALGGDPEIIKTTWGLLPENERTKLWSTLNAEEQKRLKDATGG